MPDMPNTTDSPAVLREALRVLADARVKGLCAHPGKPCDWKVVGDCVPCLVESALALARQTVPAEPVTGEIVLDFTLHRVGQAKEEQVEPAPPTVREIVAAHLKEIGADGLAHCHESIFKAGIGIVCTCKVDNLMPCEFRDDCLPAYFRDGRWTMEKPEEDSHANNH